MEEGGGEEEEGEGRIFPSPIKYIFADECVPGVGELQLPSFIMSSLFDPTSWQVIHSFTHTSHVTLTMCESICSAQATKQFNWLAHLTSILRTAL